VIAIFFTLKYVYNGCVYFHKIAVSIRVFYVKRELRLFMAAIFSITMQADLCDIISKAQQIKSVVKNPDDFLSVLFFLIYFSSMR